MSRPKYVEYKSSKSGHVRVAKIPEVFMPPGVCSIIGEYLNNIEYKICHRVQNDAFIMTNEYKRFAAETGWVDVFKREPRYESPITFGESMDIAINNNQMEIVKVCLDSSMGHIHPFYLSKAIESEHVELLDLFLNHIRNSPLVSTFFYMVHSPNWIVRHAIKYSSTMVVEYMFTKFVFSNQHVLDFLDYVNSFDHYGLSAEGQYIRDFLKKHKKQGWAQSDRNYWILWALKK
jgi:hypothetical protein